MTQPNREPTIPMLGAVQAPSLPRTKSRSSFQLGEYRVLGLLARGGTGGVYLGEHFITGKRVALKVLDPHWGKHDDIVTRMLDEHAIAQSARHPGLLEIHEATRASDGTPYLVMELLDGENLGDLVERGRVVIGAIAAIGAQVAAAVAALHDAGYIHCDIKPDNVFVLYEAGLEGWPRVKVIDYGVSQKTDAPARDSIAGTPSCMSPEQWRGATVAKSDVYSLGCLLYWLVTGNPPFSGPLPQLMLAHSNQLAARPSTTRQQMPGELERMIMRCLQKDPAMRPTMRELARDLETLASWFPTGDVGTLLEAVG